MSRIASEVAGGIGQIDFLERRAFSSARICKRMSMDALMKDASDDKAKLVWSGLKFSAGA
jgi:hypothetical protein